MTVKHHHLGINGDENRRKFSRLVFLISSTATKLLLYEKNMKFSASAAIFLAVCLAYVHADEHRTPSYGGHRPSPYRPPSPKPHRPVPYHSKPIKPLPYHPKPQRPMPYKPKPQYPLPYRPKPQRPTPFKPKPQRPMPFKPKPQRPNRPWMMQPQSDNTNININRNTNSNEDIILAELFSQLLVNEDDPCLFDTECFDKKLKTKDIVVEAKANITQVEEVTTTSDAADAATNDIEAAVSSDIEAGASDDSEASLDKTEEEDAVVVESRQEEDAVVVETLQEEDGSILESRQETETEDGMTMA